MTMLTTDQLAALEERWRRVKAPIARSLLPGVSADEIHSAFEEFPQLTIPRELELWWGWHNGADPKLGSDRIGGDNKFITLDKAVAVYRKEFDYLPEEEEHLLQWILSGRPWLRIECTPESPDIGSIWFEGFGEESRLVLPSLGHAVEVWTDAIDRGLYLYNLIGPFSTGVALDQIDDRDVILNSVL